MRIRLLLGLLTVGTLFTASQICFARGFGGGGHAGGGFHGGGMGGGMPHGGFGGGGMGGMPHGGFGGSGMGGMPRGGFGGGGASGGFGGGFGGGAGGGMSGSRGNLQGLGAGGMGGGFNRAGSGMGGGQFGGVGGAGARMGAGGLDGRSEANRFSSPSRGQLNSFLGLPSDEGMHGLQAGGLGGNFDVNRGAVEGPRGGYAAGATVTGPRGNTAGRAAAVGPDGGVAAARGVSGAGGAAGVQGAAVGAGGRVAAGGAVRGPEGGMAARGVAAGPNRVADGFARVTPAGRYNCASAVRGDYNHWGDYRRGWYGEHPGAWMAAGWAVGEAWRIATWDSIETWMAYNATAPVYYDYGNSVVYQDDNVYVNGQSTGTTAQYYDQASTLATTGTQADAYPSDDWLPLGVFVLAKPDHSKSVVSIQMAVNKQGIIRGNYTDTVTGKTQPIHGAVDKKTQRVAITVGDNSTNVIETGIYNLTKDEAPALLHFGKDRTEQWLLVRLQNPDETAGT